MAFPVDLTTFQALTDGVTDINSTLLGQYRTSLMALERLLVGNTVINAVGKGADPTGVADSSAACAAAIQDLGAGGGTVLFPPGDYRMDTLVKVPSRVRIQGSGQYATRFFQPATSVDTFMFETDDVGVNTGVNLFGQTYGQIFEGFEIRDRASTYVYLTPTGRSEDHHGIYLHETDWGLIRDVNIRDLRGIALDFRDQVREWMTINTYVMGCGDSAESAPAVNIASTTGDATNTLFFHGFRVIYPEYRGVQIEGSQNGIRLINFLQCQFEGGGNGSGGSLGNPFPHDIVWVGRAENVAFTGCNFANPGSAKWCLNLNGNATGVPYRIDVTQCRFNANTFGGAIRVGQITGLAVYQTVFEASTAGQADYYVETNAGIIHNDPSNVPSGNPTAGSPAGHFRGRVDLDNMNYADNVLELTGGGVVAYCNGVPSVTMLTGQTYPNGIHNVFDIGGFVWWERPTFQGLGEIWVPRSGQVIARQAESIFASDTNERTVFTYTVPQGYMTAVTGFEVEVWGDFSGTGVGTATLRIKIGGTTLYADASAALVSGVQPWHVRFTVRNMISVAVQRIGGLAIIGAVGTATTGVGDLATDEIAGISPFQASGTIDFSTAARAIDVTWQHSAAKVTTVRAGFGRYI